MELFSPEERAANLAAQAASTIESSFDVVGGLSKASIRHALDAEIANEGGKVTADGSRVILSDGTQVAWTPPPAELAIPNWSTIKSIRHYFGSRGYAPYPAWLYHPVKEAVLVKDAKEAAVYGIVYRKTTEDERQRFGVQALWDWESGSEWRPRPHGEQKRNFADHAGTKNLVSHGPDPQRVQADLVASVAAAVAQVLKLSPGNAAPAAVDPAQWDEFVKFQAWKKASEAVAIAADAGIEGDSVEVDHSVNALSPEQDRMLWEEEAKRLHIKVDGRWSIERLKAEVQKAQDVA